MAQWPSSFVQVAEVIMELLLTARIHRLIVVIRTVGYRIMNIVWSRGYIAVMKPNVYDDIGDGTGSSANSMLF